MGAPRGLDPWILGAEPLARGVERGAGEEHLPRAGERLDARGEVDRQTFDQERLGGSRRRRPLGDLAEMDADADRRQLGVVVVGRLEPECEAGRRARGLEGEEETVAGAVDLATAVRGQQRSNEIVMARDDRRRGVVAEASLEAGRLHQVGEDQRQQARAADVGPGCRQMSQRIPLPRDVPRRPGAQGGDGSGTSGLSVLRAALNDALGSALRVCSSHSKPS